MYRLTRRDAVAVILCIILSAALAAPARAGLFGSNEAEKALEAAMKDVGQLLQMIEKPDLPFHHTRARNLLAFVDMDKGAPGDVDVPEFEGIQGAYWEFTLPLPLSYLADYMYNPAVPPHAIYPGSVRMGGWHDAQNAAKTLEGLYGALPDAESALSYRGKELEVTTPDPNSGSYYSYDVNRLVAGYEAGGIPTIVSVSRMAGKSSVGRKGLAFGPPGSWYFFYSGQPGNLMSGLGWAEAFMYDAITVFVLREETPGRSTVGLLKWVKAGWKGMNMVKSKHILDGCKDFADNVMTVLTAPNLPAPGEIARATSAISLMPEDEMRRKLAPLEELLQKSAAENEDLRREEFAPLVEGGGYLESLSKEELEAELVKIYMREAVGKSVLKSP